MTPALLNVEQLAVYLGRSVDTVRREFRSRDDFPLPVDLGEGTSPLWATGDVAAWVDALPRRGVRTVKHRRSKHDRLQVA